MRLVRYVFISHTCQRLPSVIRETDSFGKVETTLGPIELLDALQAIENGLGRRKLIDKGPRNIDLDILLYNNETVSHPRLNIPHKLMLEREFVLRPLCQ